ncbi:MAG: hypothetical protein JWO95_2850 [Verrucomicrobiales bacterium]|nr:hypothetical protein [Verrucomicrobiales bacterium]
MARKDFIPQKDADFLAWHDTFKAAAVASGTTYGLTAAEVTQISADNADFHAKYSANNAAQVAAKNGTTAKNTSRVITEGRSRLYANRIKASAGFSLAVGDTYGINGPESTFNIHTAAPVIKGKALVNGQSQIDFTNPHGDGVNLYCKRGAETESSFLARDTESPYIDTRPLLVAGKPEQREYKAVYVQDGVEVGNWSESVIVTCAP